MDSPSPSAETLLCDFLATRSVDPGADFASFCRDHPEQATELDELLMQHDRLASGLDHIAAGGDDAQRWLEVLDDLRRPRSPAERYRIGDEIGAGGMGRVVEAFDRVFDRSLCMKLMHAPADVVAAVKTPSVASRSLSQFVAEARLTGRLDHPGIVPVHDVGVDERGHVFFTMKRVRGDDLEKIFAAHHRGDAEWTSARLVMVLLRACEAVAYAHSRGVVHRDLKPANIMVGSFGETYVMDWGLARALQGVESHRANPIVGTPVYMAPEQARGEPVGPSADVYGMGGVLYQLLAGRPPVQEASGSTARDIIARVTAEPPIAVDLAAPEAPPELAAICARAIARSPGDRYPDMAAMADDLRAYLEGRVVQAHRTGALVELRKWIQRNPLAAAAAAVALCAIVGGVGAVGVIESRAAKALTLENAKVVAANQRIREESRTREAALDLMTDMFDEADPHRLRGADLTVLEVLESARAQLPDRLAAEPGVFSQLAARMARVYGMLGRPEPAHELLARTLAVQERRGVEDLETQRTRKALAIYENNLGNFDAAEQLSRQVLAALDELPDAPPEDLLETRKVLGSALTMAGKYGAAIDELRAVVDALRGMQTPDEAQLADAASQLGYALMQNGDNAAARELLQTAHERAAARVDQNSRQLLAIRLRLGELCTNDGLLDEATELYRAAEETTTRLYPADHPDRLAVTGSIASLLVRQNRDDEALPLLRQVHEGYRSKFGDDHRMTWIAAINLASGLRKRGDLEAAEALFAAVHDQIEAGRLEPFAQMAVHSGNGLVEIWAATGRRAEAIALLRERVTVLAATEQEHTLQDTRSRLGKQLFVAGDFAGAVAVLRPAWQWQRDHDTESRRRSTGSALTAALLRLRRGEEAVPVAAYEREHLSPATPPAERADIDFNYVQALIHAGRLDDAAAQAAVAREYVDANLPAGSPQWARARMASFDVEMNRKDYDAAEPWVAAVEADGSQPELARMMRSALRRMRERARKNDDER